MYVNKWEEETKLQKVKQRDLKIKVERLLLILYIHIESSSVILCGWVLQVWSLRSSWWYRVVYRVPRG